MINKKIDKTLSIPLHHQLYLIMKELIEEETLKEGEILLSESKLQEKFDVSRITVRRALSDLEHDGLVIRKKGIGTYVAPKRIEHNLAQFNSFSSRALAEGDVPGSVVLVSKLIKPSVKVSEKLNLSKDSEVYYLKRLRLLNGKVIAVHDSYISLNFNYTAKELDFDSNTSLYQFFLDKGIELGGADEVLESRMPSHELAQSLFIERNVPIMYKERVTYTSDNLPIEYSENSYIGDRYKYNIKIKKAELNNEEI